MKTKLTFLLSLLTCSLLGQQFTKVINGPVVNTPGDSRSVNFIDLNGDGWDDLFISNGLSGGQAEQLFINQGDGSFTVAPEMDLTTDAFPSVGATFADWDNDGDLDAYVTNWHGFTNHFYKNENGILNQYAVPDQDSWNSYAETASWADYDLDGQLDLYVTNSGGDRKNRLFGGGNETFTSIALSGTTGEADYSRNVSWVDVNGDGRPDLFVTNENNQRNDLYLNFEDGFEQVVSGPIVESQFSTMGCSWGDIDNDGDLDLFVANAGYYQQQANQLYRNEGNGNFVLLDLEDPSIDEGCSFGSAFVDYDNDADLDLMVVNGFCNGNLGHFMYENLGQGTFQKRNDLLPDTVELCSYGLAWSDINQDGFMDFAVANCKNISASPQPNNDLYFNNGNDNHWLRVDLVGTLSNRTAVGAIVRIKALINGEMTWQMRDVNTQSGYCGQNSMTQHFGLGDATSVDSIVVEWPSGSQSVLTTINTNQRIAIQEDEINETIELPSVFQSLVLSPNPALDKIRLEWQLSDPSFNAGPIHLRILNIQGQSVYEHPALHQIRTDSMQVVLPTAQLHPGTYFVELKTGQLALHRKFIKH